MITYHISAYSQRGVDRKRNEDSCAVGKQFLFGQDTENLQISISDFCLPFLICLADGMGGHKDGNIASRKAVNFISNSFYNSKEEFDIEKTVTHTHQAIQSHSNKSHGALAMGTTIVGAVLKTKKCTIFNVGDSRAYLMNDEGITQVSVDHISWDGYRPYISQCLGSGNSSPPIPHIKTCDIFDGNQLILVSDGITDVVSDEKIFDIVMCEQPPALHRLCSEAVSLGGGDDVSAVRVCVKC